jgi:hypothetical protein
VLDETDIPLYLVVEPNEVLKHTRFLKEQGLLNNVTDILKLPKKNMGMGWSRQIAFEHAREQGYASFITTDDDMFPRESPAAFLDNATRPDVLGVGCWFSIYGLLMSQHEAWSGLQPVYNGQGKRCMAINTENMSQLSTEGFPTYFKGYDDHELQRLGIADLGLHWWVDTDFHCVSTAAIGDPGGMCSLPGYAKVVNRKHTAHKLTHERWPGFVSDPAKCDPENDKCRYVMQWKKFHKAHNVAMEEG